MWEVPLPKLTFSLKILLCHLFPKNVWFHPTLERIGYPEKDLCKSCSDKEESVQHFLCDCPALQGCRLQCRLGHNFHNFECFNDVQLIWIFVDWFEVRPGLKESVHFYAIVPPIPGCRQCLLGHNFHNFKCFSDVSMIWIIWDWLEVRPDFKESIQHFLCDCPVLQGCRLQI